MSENCKKYGHHYHTTDENDKGFTDTCKICSKTVHYPKTNGVIDEEEYAKNNQRKMIQPHMTLAWSETYGKESDEVII